MAPIGCHLEIDDRRFKLAGSFRRAVQAFERGDIDEAAGQCRSVLERHPRHFDALHLLGVLESKSGRPADALPLFDRALAIRTGDPDLCNNRGSALVELGRLSEALASYNQALAAREAFADAHNNRGCVLMFMGRNEEALASYGRALVLSPDCADYMNNLGRVLTRLMRYDEALGCFDDAIATSPGFADAMLNRGRVLEQLQAFDEAVVAYGEAMDAGVDLAAALPRRAGALQAAKRFREALADYDRALRLFPDKHDLLLGRSATLAHLGRLAEAFAGFDAAVARGVRLRDVLLARCVTLNALDQTDAAIPIGENLVELSPDDAEAQNALGMSLMKAERFGEAVACYETALSLRPDYPLVEWNLGYLLLLLGRYREGFRRYEGRRRQEGTRGTRLAGPEWRGEPLGGKRILVYAEQAFGDTIHYARYIGILTDMGATVILGVYAPLAALMRSARGSPEIVLPGAALPPYDLHLPMMSVPNVLGHDMGDTPGQPYLAADPRRVAFWKERLPAARLKIGIAWQGSLSIPGRSIPLAAFAPLAAIPGVRLISLQKSDGLDQLADLPIGMDVHTLGPDFDQGDDAFLDTAAVMASLDLIVSVDTAVAHLGGALGRPIWIVLKTVPDWRWMLDRPDSPWYPTARLFRRRKDEDWSATMAVVAAELERLVADRASNAEHRRS